MSWRVIPQVCPRCGMPDLREVRRDGNLGVYYVDLRCVDCDYVDWDIYGGV